MRFGSLALAASIVVGMAGSSTDASTLQAGLRADPSTLQAGLRADASTLQAGLRALPAAEPATEPIRPASPDRFGWPLPGFPPVVRPFDPPEHRYGRGHRGVDLAGWAGQAVLAAGDGVVVFAGPLAGRGVVSVDHAGGLRSTYEPVRAVVTPGQRVLRGQQIGMLESGHAGCAAPACLHWGLRRGQDYLDPLRLLGGRVRLLPLGDTELGDTER